MGLISLRLGKETVKGQKLDVFRGRFKVLVLLYSIDENGQDVLYSGGCDAVDAYVTYDKVMTHLKNIFGTEETVDVKTRICYR